MPKGVYIRTKEMMTGKYPRTKEMGTGKYLRTVKGNRNMGLAKKGKPLSEKHCRAISLGRKGIIFSEEHKKNISKAFKGVPLSEERKRKISLSLLGRQLCLGYKWTDEQKEKLSMTRKKLFRNGELEVSFPNNWYLTISGIKVRSPWEKEICDLLTNFGIKYEYEKQRFILDHTTYLPDLYLPEYDLWIEIKGRMDKDSIKKIELFSKDYSLLVIGGEKYREIQNTPESLLHLIQGAS